MADIKWKLVTKKVSELKPYHKNPRSITEQGLKDLKKSVDKFGLAEPIVVNTDFISGYKPDKLGRMFKRYIKKCIVCQDWFLLPKHKINKRKYCSHKCGAQVYAKMNGSQKRDLVSQRNKNPDFILKVKRGLKNHFAKNPRVNEKWYLDRYGANYIPKSKYKVSGDWRTISRDVIKQKPYCMRCCVKEKLNVHHIISYSLSKDNSLNNLVVLCKSCHKITEDNNIKIFNIVNDWEVVRALYITRFEDNKFVA